MKNDKSINYNHKKIYSTGYTIEVLRLIINIHYYETFSTPSPKSSFTL